MADKLTPDAIREMMKDVVDEAHVEKMDELKALIEEAKAKGGSGEDLRNYTPGIAGSDENRVDVQPKSAGVHPNGPVKGARAARFIRALAATRNDVSRAAELAKSWGDEAMAKSLLSSNFAQGGALVPQPLMDEVIEALRSNSVVRALGARVIPMPNGRLDMPRVATGTTGSWTAEGVGPNATGMTFEHVSLSAKKLMGVVPVSKDLLEDATGAADEIVAEDLSDELAVKEDIAFIRADGTGNQPSGIRQVTSTNVPSHLFQITHAGAVATNAEIIADLCRAMVKPKSAKVRRRNPGWMFTSRIEMHLFCLLDDQANFIFRDEMSAGRLFGFPFATTEEIPENLDVSGSLANDETEVYFVDFGHVMIGETRQVRIEAMDGVAYKDSGGTLQSGFSNDEMVVKATTRVDIALRHLGREAAIIEAVDWGA